MTSWLGARPRHVAAPLLAAVVLVAPLAAGGLAAAASEQIIDKAYTTGYTWYDNTPPGSAAIAKPVLHNVAAGVGTYADPITVAVGINESGTWDYPAGTRMYVPNLRRYLIVEDQCGANASSPCHSLAKAPSGATTWIDIWVDGRETSDANATACANKITALHRIVVNPASTYAVASGSGVFHDGACDSGYGETLVSTSQPTTSTPTTTTTTKPPTTSPTQPTTSTTTTTTTTTTTSTTTTTKPPTTSSTTTTSTTSTTTTKPPTTAPTTATPTTPGGTPSGSGLPASATKAQMLMTITPGLTRYDDEAAPTGDHVIMKVAGRNSGTLAGSGNLTIWAKGDSCNGAPTMQVTVDGQAASYAVTRADGFGVFVTPFAVASGTHAIAIAYDNAYSSASCTRTLHIGGVAFTG